MGAGIDHITAGNQLREHRKMAEPVEFGEILEVEADLNELEELLSHAKRPKTRSLIETEAARLKAFLHADANNTTPEPAAAPAPQAAAAPAASSGPVLLSHGAAAESNNLQYMPIDKFAWDQGEYNTRWLTIYITSGIDGVGEVKDSVSCDFGSRSFDLKIPGLNGKSYRMLKNRLDEDIDVKKSKFVVKKNAVHIKLHKTKGDESYASYKTWMNLETKKSKEQEAKSKDDPTAGIMDLMKDMYDDGDDNMKKAIGEAMLKSKENRGSGHGMDDE